MADQISLSDAYIRDKLWLTFQRFSIAGNISLPFEWVINI
jgi:hypothetical protein